MQVTNTIQFIYKNKIIKTEHKQGQQGTTCSAIMDIPNGYKFDSKAIFMFDNQIHQIKIVPKGSQQNIQQNHHPIHRIKREPLPDPNQKNSFIPVKETMPQTPKAVKEMLQRSVQKATKQQPNKHVQSKTSTLKHFPKSAISQSKQNNMTKPSSQSQSKMIYNPNTQSLASTKSSNNINQQPISNQQSAQQNHPQQNKQDKLIYQFKDAKKLSDIKKGQTKKYKGYLITNRKSRMLNQYVMADKPIAVYQTILSAIKHPTLHTINVASMTTRVLNVFHIQNHPTLYQINMNNQSKYILAKYTQLAYLQPEDINTKLVGLIPHAEVKVLHNIQAFNNIQGTQKAKDNVIKAGQMIQITGIKPVGLPENHVYKLLTANGHYITANKNYVKLV